VAFVAEDSGKAYAFVAASILSKQAIAEAEGSQDGAEADELSDTTILSRMWVAPQNRHQGLGQALIQAVTLWAKAHNQRRVVLGVTEGNEIAKRCYLRAGFVPNALVFPHPWHPDLKVYGMELDL
jgi:GNAT superfamily N-acetyltransferase